MMEFRAVAAKSLLEACFELKYSKNSLLLALETGCAGLHPPPAFARFASYG
jgi:hypothetical protein